VSRTALVHRNYSRQDSVSISETLLSIIYPFCGHDSLIRPLRGFDPRHRFIEDIKRKDFVPSVGLAEAQVCGPKLMRDFVAACWTMLPLVEFVTRALGLQP
jgi:uncharacterized protein (DUF2461 family)